MANSWTNVAAAAVADADGYLHSIAMKVGDYVLDHTAPTFGARHVTLKRAVVVGADTPGTVIIVGKDLAGQTITETLIPGANGVTVTGTRFFASVASATGAGWVISGAGDEDTLEIGFDELNAVATGPGTLHSLTINTAAAAAIQIFLDGTSFAVIPANQAAGSHFVWDAGYTGSLRVEPVGASDITVIHSGSRPQTYVK